jgi:hypothetical protein
MACLSQIRYITGNVLGLGQVKLSSEHILEIDRNYTERSIGIDGIVIHYPCCSDYEFAIKLVGGSILVMKEFKEYTFKECTKKRTRKIYWKYCC